MTSQPLNRRLTSSDASFLYVEKPNQPMHIGGCMIYEGKLSRDDVIAIVRRRIDRLPRYRQRVVFPPFNVDHPTWEDDPQFDVANHIVEQTLPAPGDDRILSETGGRNHAEMLDRDRPLWQLALLHGYQDGNTAMIMKVHHAMVDGVSGVDLMLVLHELTADGTDEDPAPQPWQPRQTPDALTLLQDAVRDQLTSAAERWTRALFDWWRPGQIEEQTRRLTAGISTTLPDTLIPAPRTPFNAPLSSRRQFAWMQIPFGDIRFIRGALGGTVNDAVLAVIAGGLGRYLRAHDHSTTGVQLRAMCPVSMRRPDKQGALGNLVSMIIAPLYVDIDDPVDRLNAERAAMERLKAADQPGGLYQMTESANLIPPALQALSLAGPAQNTLVNTVSTNVPGPQIPLYLGGRQLLHWIPLGPLATSIGLFNAILSYNQVVTIGATFDPALVPDGWFYARCLRESFDELYAAAARLATPPPAVVPDGGGRRESRTTSGTPARAPSRPRRAAAGRRTEGARTA